MTTNDDTQFDLVQQISFAPVRNLENEPKTGFGKGATISLSGGGLEDLFSADYFFHLMFKAGFFFTHQLKPDFFFTKN